MTTYQIKYRGVNAKGRYPGWYQQDPDRLALQSAKVEERRSIVDFVFILDFALLIFKMQYSPSLGMVERSASVERAEYKGEKNHAGNSLES